MFGLQGPSLGPGGVKRTTPDERSAPGGVEPRFLDLPVRSGGGDRNDGGQGLGKRLILLRAPSNPIQTHVGSKHSSNGIMGDDLQHERAKSDLH